MQTPGVFIQETSPFPLAIEGVPTGVAGFAGYTQRGDPAPLSIASLREYETAFGTALPSSNLYESVRAFFDNGGRTCYIAPAPDGLPAALARLAAVPVNILAAPDSVLLPPPDFAAFAQAMLAQCAALRDRFAILDVPIAPADFMQAIGAANLSYGAAYLPFLNASGLLLPPSGFVAGVYAATDFSRGVFKSPANVALTGVQPPVAPPPPPEFPVNPIREFPGRGILVWGARTLDAVHTELRYIGVRRFLIFLEQSIALGLQALAFEPNQPRRWQLAQSMTENFLRATWADGALLGRTPSEAFYVKCGLGATMTQSDIDNGRLRVEIGVAAVRPAEFVILRIVLVDEN